ncbi:hypothetical protein BGZ63DRAFT_457493 [Mariannaea sp. PMI_226]|nr:hypothetical protein BGZ63DRAFT_457493 [Mariannaea sp. PMI_226]
MDCLACLLQCFTSSHDVTGEKHNLQTNEKAVVSNQPVPYQDDAARQFVEALRTADKCGTELEDRLNEIVSANGWTESLAEAILHGVETILKQGGLMAAAMKDATKKATALAKEFATEHPYYAALIAGGTLIALGVLAVMAPAWILRALGFILKGPRSNSFASRWMSQIAQKYGHVSKGSLYSYLQRLGMTWK